MTDGPIETSPGPEGTESVSGPEGATDNGGHPAWQPILDVLPDEALRTLVQPHLQEWDKGVEQRFQSLHQQYEPWKPIIENADPEVTQRALQLVSMIEEDPAQVYQMLGEAYGLTSGQGTGEPPAGTTTDPVEVEGAEFDPNDPVMQRLMAMEGVLGGLQNFIQSQQQHDEEVAAIEAYDAHMKSLLEDPRFKGGPYDEDVIDAMVANGIEPEDALTRYQTSVREAAKSALTPNSTAPTIMGASAGGSGLPSGAVDPAKMSPQDTRALVAEMARRAAEAQRT